MQATFFKSDEQEREEARKRTGEFGPRLEWSELELGMVISAFNYGQVRTTAYQNDAEKSFYRLAYPSPFDRSAR